MLKRESRVTAKVCSLIWAESRLNFSPMGYSFLNKLSASFREAVVNLSRDDSCEETWESLTCWDYSSVTVFMRLSSLRSQICSNSSTPPMADSIISRSLIIVLNFSSNLPCIKYWSSILSWRILNYWSSVWALLMTSSIIRPWVMPLSCNSPSSLKTFCKPTGGRISNFCEFCRGEES